MDDYLELPPIGSPVNAFEFLIGIIFNQQISGVRAWQSAKQFRARAGACPFELAAHGGRYIQAAIVKPPALHPFADVMTHAVHQAADRVLHNMDGDAQRLWCSRDSGQTLREFQAFPQIGNHKASIAVLLLAEVYDIFKITTNETEAILATCTSLRSHIVEGTVRVRSGATAGVTESCECEPRGEVAALRV